MKGAGYYDQHSSAQMSSILALQRWIDDAALNLSLPDSARPVTILDLGSSEGRNAIQVMATIVAGLRRRTSQPLQTIYSDLASNNFNQLFTNLDQARRAGLFDGGVYPAAVGGSFYGQLLPPGTVHLATSFNAILWLDQLPAQGVRDFVVYRRPHPPRPGADVSAEVAAAFARQAEQDLVHFLDCRARELAVGGKLLLATPGDTEQVCTCDGLYDVLNDASLDLVAAGQLDREQYVRLTIPVYFRTLAEVLAPLEREDSPVRGAFAVDRAEALEIPIPFIVEFQRGGDVTAYGDAYTGFLRAVSEPVVRTVLNQPEKDAAIVESLYERMHARLVAQPQRYLWRYIQVAALLTRR
jgi:hypothetical protein